MGSGITIILLSSLLYIQVGNVTSRGSYYLPNSKCLKPRSISLFTTMATKDTTLQSDISKMKTEPDGSFKRADSSFRNTIAKDSQFEPEIGGFQCLHVVVFD